jgi:pimeloyl-ACP methyl ester carboxylesterase
VLALLALPYMAPLFLFRPGPLESADPRGWRVPAAEESIVAADGSRLSAWWAPPPSPQAPVVLLVHGRSGNVTGRAAIVRRLAADGFGVLAFDYRGYGASGGSASEQAMGEDTFSAYDWLRGRGVPPGRIVVLGQSLGNAPAARLASLRPVAGLALVSPFASLPGAAADRISWLPLGLVPWPRNRFEVESHLRAFRGPLIFAVSRRDRLVPYDHARRLADSLPRRPHWIEEARHGHDGLLAELVGSGRLQPFLSAAGRGDPGR